MTLSPHIFHCGFLVFLGRTFLEVISFSSTYSGSVLALTYDSAPPHSFPRRVPWAEPGPAKGQKRWGPPSSSTAFEDLSESSVMSQKAQVWGLWVDRKTSFLCVSISPSCSWFLPLLALPSCLRGCLIPLLGLHPIF